MTRLAWIRLGWVVAILLCVAYVGLALTPSDYSCVLSRFEIANPGLLFGHCQPWRSDEYAVMTPYFQISVLNHFGAVNRFSPYHEIIQSFFALPTFDFGLLLRPQLWAFHILPPAYAYSIYWLIQIISFPLSYYFLFRAARVSSGLAICGGLLIFFSQFSQLLFVSHGGLLAFIGWIGVALLAELSPLRRYIAVAFATAITLFSDLYPPFFIAGLSGLAVFVFAVDPGRWRDWRQVLAVLLGLATAAGLATGYYWDLIVLMRDTVYPGQRESTGGGLNPLQLLGTVLPYITTLGSTVQTAAASVVRNVNPIEIGIIGSWLPVLAIVFMRWRSLGRTLVAQRWFIIVVVTGLALMALWMFATLPSILAHLLLWDRVPSSRITFGFALLLMLAVVYLVDKIELTFSPGRVLVFAGIVITAWLASSWLARLTGAASLPALASLRSDWTDLLVLAPFAAWVVVVAWWGGSSTAKRGLGLAMVATFTSVVTFGSFNPLQSATQIFASPDSAKVDIIAAAAKASHEKPLAVAGFYGGELAGWGLPVINHVLVYPQLTYFRRLYPNLPPDTFNTIFNRYAHIEVDPSLAEPKLVQADLVAIPATGLTMVDFCNGTLPKDFDPQRYLQLYPDVAAAKVDPAQHYIKHGCAEGRSYK